MADLRPGDKFKLPCEKCGKPMLFAIEEDSTWTVRHPGGCGAGVVTLHVQHPRRLGVITGLSSEDK